MITEGSRPRSPALASSCAPLGLTRAYTAQNGKVTEQKKVSFKVELDTSVPEQASFKQFLEQFDDATKATILANYPKMTRAKDENAGEDQKKMAIDPRVSFARGAVQRRGRGRGEGRQEAPSAVSGTRARATYCYGLVLYPALLMYSCYFFCTTFLSRPRGLPLAVRPRRFAVARRRWTWRCTRGGTACARCTWRLSS